MATEMIKRDQSEKLPEKYAFLKLETYVQEKAWRQKQQHETQNDEHG